MTSEESPTLDAVIGRNLRRLREARGWSQDEAAVEARRTGLQWSRSTVGALETGAKTLDFSEAVLLTLVLNEPLKKLLAGNDDPVRVGTVEPSLRLIRRVVKKGPSNASRFTFRHLEEVRSAARLLEEQHEGSEAVERAAHDEATMAAARKLNADPFDVSITAFELWGRSLTDERDARVDAPPGTPRRSLQALRGQLTRELVKDLRAQLEGG